VFEQLLWELAEGGIEFVNEATLLQRFSGVIEASEKELEVAIRERRDYLVVKYGPDAAKAFTDLDPLDLPRTLAEVQREALARMEAEVEAARQSARSARTTAALTQEERVELAKLREREKERVRKAKKRLRRALSRKGKRRGPRGRKWTRVTAARRA
jgi:hypothetical protein